MSWRCIGPAAMSGRIVAVAVNESDPSTYWIATASGGLLKTVNTASPSSTNSTMKLPCLSATCASRRAIQHCLGGDGGEQSAELGVLRGRRLQSTDGGKTWKNMGLKKSFQIGRIVVHPKNPNIVYVGALGRLYGPTRSGACSNQQMGARAGRKSSMSTIAQVSST